jgi:hypothetical protein
MYGQSTKSFDIVFMSEVVRLARARHASATCSGLASFCSLSSVAPIASQSTQFAHFLT